MTRQRAFDISWRLAVLSLPWQTRWFHDASLAGWPWEQGRWSVYASWALIAAPIVVGFPSFRRSLTRPKKRFASYCFAALFACSVIPILFRADQAARFVAVSQWWIQALLLLGFGLTLVGVRVAWRSFATWFVVSLIPQALLGVVQYATQMAIGSKWLGMATHMAETPGTAVVEFGLFRYLRVYGGFPHPNIFGGWLAVGLTVSMLLAGAASSKKHALFAIISSALFSIVLLLTFSRSAWVAAFVGIAVLMIVGYKRVSERQFFVLALAAALVAAGVVGFSQRAVLFARADTSSRLETKSIDERSQSLKDGVALFLVHPLFGSGPNAELLDLRNLDAQRAEKLPTEYRAPQPLEPPHDVPLLALADLGIVGLLLIGACLTQLIRRIPRAAWPFVSLIICLGLFDHYLWSTWSGASLVLILAAQCVLTRWET